MKKQLVEVYISDNCAECEELITYLRKADIPFHIKNTSTDKKYLTELQAKDIFITPAIVIDDYYKIMGFQPDKIERLIQS